MPIELLPDGPEWPVRYERQAEALRQALGCVAVRVDQIGSTALPGLAAKGGIDIQVSVRSWEPDGPHRWPFERRGYASRPDDELERRLCTSNQTVGRRLLNIHPWVAGGAPGSDVSGDFEISCCAIRKPPGNMRNSRDSSVLDTMTQMRMPVPNARSS
jgi:hypothetical protein